MIGSEFEMATSKMIGEDHMTGGCPKSGDLSESELENPHMVVVPKLCVMWDNHYSLNTNLERVVPLVTLLGLECIFQNVFFEILCLVLYAENFTKKYIIILNEITFNFIIKERNLLSILLN